MTTVDQTGFFQEPPKLHDEWEDDLALRRLIERVVPAEIREEVTPSLAEMGHLAANDLKAWSDEMDTRAHEPRLVQFDAWGGRVDRLDAHLRRALERQRAVLGQQRERRARRLAAGIAFPAPEAALRFPGSSKPAAGRPARAWKAAGRAPDLPVRAPVRAARPSRPRLSTQAAFASS